jgi:SCY1-like protein 1
LYGIYFVDIMFSSITSFISNSISALPYRLLNDGVEIIHPCASVGAVPLWKQYDAVRTAPGMGAALVGATGDPCSVFTFDKRNANTDQQSMAKNALIRLKTLRHPNILKFIDSVDLPTHLHILTEKVTPLQLNKSIPLSNTKEQLAASLGLQQIISSISWMNNEAKLIHSNLHPGSIYVNESGDWKLSGLDLTHKGTEPIPDALLIGRNSGILPTQFRAPELIKNASNATPPQVLHATDAWALGCTIYNVFHGSFSSPQQLASATLIPPSLLPDYKKLLATNPGNRLNPKYLLENCPFFQNELVSSVEFLNNLALKSPQEKDIFFNRFALQVTEFPPEFCKSKLLPLLTSSLEYGSGLTCFGAILQSVLQIGGSLTETEFANLVLPSVLKLFSSNERAIRVHLLQHLGTYAGSLSAILVNDSIFTHVQTGFNDSNATLRELTVKSLLHLAPKLNPANMEIALKHLARLQGDPEPAIRTNTGYCLAKIAPSLSPLMQEKVLFHAFSKCLRDPFPPARIAGLMAFLATLELHKSVDVARKILPVIAPILADDTKEVREAALKLLEAITQKMHAFHAQLKQQQEAALAANPNAIGSHQLAGIGQTASSQQSPSQSSSDTASSALGQAGAVLGTLGSWAASTVRSKISNADTQQSQSAATQASRNMGGGLQSTASRSTTNTATSSASASSVGNASPNASFGKSDDFFDDFNKDADEDDATTVVALSTSKKSATGTKSTGGAGAAKKEKKSIVASGSSSSSNSALFSISPPPSSTAANANSSTSLDNWDFDLSDSSTSTKASPSIGNNNDFDDWGSSVGNGNAATATPASLSTSHSKKVSSSGSDLLSFSGTNSATHKKSAASTSNDPFAALSLSGSSPKPSTSVISPASNIGLGTSTRAKPATTVKSVNATTSTGAKKPAVDDWGDFLNS